MAGPSPHVRNSQNPSLQDAVNPRCTSTQTLTSALFATRLPAPSLAASLKVTKIPLIEDDSAPRVVVPRLLVLAESTPDEGVQTLSQYTHLDDGMDAEHYQHSLDEEEDDDEESSFVQGITAGGHDHSQDTSPPEFSHQSFERQHLSIDPALDTPPPENHPHHLHHHHHTGQDNDDEEGDGSSHHRLQQPQQQVQNHFVQSQLPRQLYTDLARSANQFSLQHHAPDQLSTPPAQFQASSPASGKILPTFTPSDRSLPDRAVTDETLDDAYVAFILYCNPSVPLDCDTAELRKAFRQPPKSDGKTFNIHHLLQLIEKFEEKEIKTWTKLAIQLGVERTADQSAQKVQQYAVRLKRWMHAMHIDAFFEYILNKPHAYYQHIPHSLPTSDSPDQMRDGVPIEEDLALRALHPETRPKRGRRKTDDKDDGSEKDMPDSKRPHIGIETPTTTDPTSAMEHFSNSLFPPHPQSAAPSSAGGDGMERFLEESDPWAAATQSVLSGGGNSATPTGGQQFRWRAFPREGTTPQSAHAPPTILTSHDNITPQDEIQTPVSTTPVSASKPRSRRRHGPAVSSAWPSSGNPLTGKLRGRPPSNRSVRDGPFSTFPAHPTGKGHTIDLSSPGSITATPTSTPVTTHAPQQFTFRPEQLHLTVPARVGGNAISMASPASAITPSPHMNGTSWKREKSPLGRESANIYEAQGLEDVERRFSVSLLQAQCHDGLVLGVEDAKRIAEKIVSALKRAWPDGGGRVDDKIVAALLGCGDDGVFREVKISRLSGGSDRRDLDDLGLDVDDGDQLNGREDGERGFDVRWSIQFGSVKGEFSQIVSVGGNSGLDHNNNPPPSSLSQIGEDNDRVLKELEGLEDFGGGVNDDPHEKSTGSSNGASNTGNVEKLRKRVLELERSLKAKEKEIHGIKENVLKAVVL
ncbi:ARS binding protein 2-domain-containing protein [Tuber indicum]|nr:ARS binding protein 2-domain-containing protein [Tuber indicum]